MERLLKPSECARQHKLSRQRIHQFLVKKDSRIIVKVFEGKKYVSSESIFVPYGNVSYNKGRR